ncbi:uncharacterized protein Triagg1_8223 [Trichoderma aggressivum f. europaeum]|uniref:Uncharacterized protein n=1 Tax=Trichoderma aggressivum f. europaeum TaxID=173218 RepID=A0AAE1I898_9HYPO|nr:hypothetical protein Triagg1_8223 [Trichoderma aggressivum f. europaeum]
MADEQAGELPYAVTSYVKDGEIDLSYRLVKICQEDGSNGSNMDKIKTDVAKPPTTAAAADSSPVSETGTAQSWEMINPEDANNVATAE